MRQAKGILNNTVFQFVLTTIIGLISIASAYNIFFLEKPVKSIQIVVLSAASLIDVESSISKDIQISYKGNNVSNLSLIQAKIENNGNQPIIDSDYARAIRFIFPSEARVLEANITESAPENIGISLQTISNTVTFSPALLNPQDRLIIRFLVTGIPNESVSKPFTVDARIVNLNRIDVISAIEQQSVPSNAVGTVMSQVFFFALILILIYLVYGGIQWITSEGDRAGTEAARGKITGALIGMIIVAISFAIYRALLVFVRSP
jgi:hypothetical protein